MVRRTTSILFLSILLTAVGCYYDVEAELYGDAVCSVPDVVLHSDHIAPIIAGKCAIGSCHVSSGTAPGELETSQGLSEMVDNGTFVDRVLDRKDMPKSGPLSACELQIIQKWLDQGGIIN
jgi:hypothetical protein